MWQAPDPEDDEDVLEVDHQQPDKEMKPLSAWFLAPDDGKCLAQTGASKRCSIARCVGSMYCKQHTNDEKAQKALFETMKDKMEKARLQWMDRATRQDEDMEKALRISLEENKVRRLHFASLQGKLGKRGCTLVEVPRDGNCQFTALLGVLPDMNITHMELRPMVVQWLDERRYVFEGFSVGFRGFSQYLEYMSNARKWEEMVPHFDIPICFLF